ncbi:hypothetical protein [Paractinoplanes lichenicola]|uniref:Uncharacterized protein n=1 Tax=Paractinoplanes lichenicola TaxID=2802976 RepID=A0ABS1VEN3_9ACTN|nr:hypothetical protein [Actinoplanes lichenicola]MBL7252765.1 hypothetical protein [Actinoplanes lichenicola]
MTRSRRLAALAMLFMAASCLLPAPVQAAPAGVEGGVHLRNLTLPAGGKVVEESLAPLLFADEAGWADSVTLTIDTSGLNVAAVTAAECSTGPVLRCVLPGPHRVFERPPDDGTYGFVTFGAVSLSFTSKPGAAAGDTGTLSIATKVDDQPATTETSTVRIGEAVNLTAVDDEPLTVAPGGSAALRPQVRNTGPAAVNGLTAVISAAEGALTDTNFGNCTYGFAIACTFTTTLTAGATYGLSSPLTLRLPGDAAAASRVSVSVQWMTAAEWEDWLGDEGPLPGDRAGTGPDLTLEEVALSAAGVPQADLDHDDNGSTTTVTVSGRRTDVVAIGATVPGTAGEHTISVGVVNQGPGTLRYPPFPNNLGNAYVTLPAPMSVVTADERCKSLAEDYGPPASAAPDEGPPEYSCALRPAALRPGQRLLFTFTVRSAPAARDEEGSVQFYLYDDGVNVDRDLANNQAPIKLAGTGRPPALPITGTIAATITVSGIVLILIGTAVVTVMRRRGLR